MSKLVIFHGSDHIINMPSYEGGKATNDYGKGFYCTLIPEMAKEWACKGNTDGFVNEYTIETENLKILDLLDGKHTVLNWIALLLKYRTFIIQDSISNDAKNYIIRNFAIDISKYDIVIGYRADDSYFSYAQSFISNTLPLSVLSKVLKLGELGQQTVLVSKKAFEQLKFIKAEPVKREIYFTKFKTRDNNARKSYRQEIKNNNSYQNEIFVLDILRQEIKNDDPRIQRIVLK